jgi:hypothetical protein
VPGTVEMLNRMSRITVWFLVLGCVIPPILFTAYIVGTRTGLVSVLGNWTWFWVLWPTAVLVMAGEGGGPDAIAIAFLVSAAANVLVYFFVGAAISAAYRRLW